VARISGVPFLSYTVEAAPSVNGPWTKVGNLTAPGADQGLGVGVIQFSEPKQPDSGRFYRTVYPAY
jgi:hypothetical protein